MLTFELGLKGWVTAGQADKRGKDIENEQHGFSLWVNVRYLGL